MALGRLRWASLALFYFSLSGCGTAETARPPALRISEPALIQVGSAWRLRANVHRSLRISAFSTELFAIDQSGLVTAHVRGGPFQFSEDHLQWASLPFDHIPGSTTYVLRTTAHVDDGQSVNSALCLRVLGERRELALCSLADEPPHIRNAAFSSENTELR